LEKNNRYEHSTNQYIFEIGNA